MRKFYILTIIICVLALTLCIEKTFYNLIDLSLGYEYVLWCGKNDKEYIKEENIKSNIMDLEQVYNLITQDSEIKLIEA